MQPLEGLKVLDLARGYPGAFATLFLADFGADVIRIDPPPGRTLSPEVVIRETAFNAVHRNKRSMIINLQHQAGKQVFYRLVKTADVLLEGFRPGVMKRLGADYETLRELNPRLVYCAASGFGQTGPYAHLPGHDMNYIALAGVLSLIGEKGGPPYLPSNLIADMAGAGLHGCIGILLALAARENTGRGQYVDISYLDGSMSLLAYEAAQYFGTGKVPRRGETNFTGAVPWVNVYRCKDGEYLTVAALEPHLYANLCRALGRDDLASKQFALPEENEKVKTEFASIFLTRTRDEWFEFFKGKDTCVGPVYYLDETFKDPQVLHRRMVVDIPHPQLGTVKQIGIPIKLSDTPGEIKTLGVPSGTHTVEIMREMGFTTAEIDELKTQGAIGFSV